MQIKKIETIMRDEKPVSKVFLVSDGVSMVVELMEMPSMEDKFMVDLTIHKHKKLTDYS